MTIKKEIFGMDNQNIGAKPELSHVDQAYFLYYGIGRQGDVFGTRGAIAMLCLEIIAQCPELSSCRIGKFGASGTELLNDEDILRAAADVEIDKLEHKLQKKRFGATVTFCAKNWQSMLGHAAPIGVPFIPDPANNCVSPMPPDIWRGIKDRINQMAK